MYTRLAMLVKNINICPAFIISESNPLAIQFRPEISYFFRIISWLPNDPRSATHVYGIPLTRSIDGRRLCIHESLEDPKITELRPKPLFTGVTLPLRSVNVGAATIASLYQDLIF